MPRAKSWEYKQKKTELKAPWSNIMQALHCHSPKPTGPPSIHHPPRKPSASVTSVPATSNNNHRIQILSRRGKLKQALTLLAHEPNPTQRTYELLLLACVRNSSLHDARSVHHHLLDNGYDRDTFLATKLIDLYSGFESIEEARQVFDEIPERSIYVYNAFLRALSLAGCGEEVLELYRGMNYGGIASDRFTYNFALKACVASTGLVSLLDKGREIHARVLRDGYGEHVHIVTTLVDVYAKYGCVSYAGRVFKAMEVKNVVSWSAMIGGYVKNGWPYEALELFRKMMADPTVAAPNSVTLVSVLQACAGLAALEQGRLLHAYILRRGLNNILPIMNALITMYARCASLEWCQRVFDQMDRRDVVSWNSLISSYGIHGHGTKAVEIFERMIKEGVQPSPITFVGLLGACSHAGLVEEGKKLFSSMKKEHGIYPISEHYACMVDLLGRAKQLDEAAKLIADMRIEPRAPVWGSLLGSCRTHCNVELAEWASQKLFKHEPKNAGNYVLLADTYAGAGLWDEVKTVRKLMDSKGLLKVPGHCWTEVRGRMYSFASVDQVNPRMEEIHALVVKLSKEMKEKGYVPDTNVVLYDVDDDEKERIILGHSEKLAVAFGLINSNHGEPIRITKNLRLCEDCHSFTKFISKFSEKQIFVRDVNRFHHFCNGVCSCGDYW